MCDLTIEETESDEYSSPTELLGGARGHKYAGKRPIPAPSHEVLSAKLNFTLTTVALLTLLFFYYTSESRIYSHSSSILTVVLNSALIRTGCFLSCWTCSRAHIHHLKKNMNL